MALLSKGLWYMWWFIILPLGIKIFVLCNLLRFDIPIQGDLGQMATLSARAKEKYGVVDGLCANGKIRVVVYGREDTNRRQIKNAAQVVENITNAFPMVEVTRVTSWQKPFPEQVSKMTNNTSTNPSHSIVPPGHHMGKHRYSSSSSWRICYLGHFHAMGRMVSGNV